MSTDVLDIQKAKLSGIQEMVSAISRNNPDAPSPYINTHHFAPGIYMRAYYLRCKTKNGLMFIKISQL